MKALKIILIVITIGIGVACTIYLDRRHQNKFVQIAYSNGNPDSPGRLYALKGDGSLWELSGGNSWYLIKHPEKQTE